MIRKPGPNTVVVQVPGTKHQQLNIGPVGRAVVVVVVVVVVDTVVTGGRDVDSGKRKQHISIREFVQFNGG